jgi:sulfoxide reductase catalytic subunit YedY
MKMKKIPSSEITPEAIYVSRRKFLAGLGIAAAGLLVSACTGTVGSTPTTDSTSTTGTTETPADTLTSYDDITGYCNFYEFTTSKTGVGGLAKDFKTSPWTVTVGGLVSHPQTFDIDDLMQKYPPEERVYRMRCVEAWSMVIPWLGFPLNKLISDAGPLSKAKFVKFVTLYDPEEMPGQKSRILDWPYTEALRLDEAMNDLTLISTGLYGKQLLPQNGAPLRLVVPWKYGFKSIKSVVSIELVEEMPGTAWMEASPSEYGFYANVNPNVPHPRWSQSSERRIGESGRRATLLFNGYGDEVAYLYQGMDLKKDF